MEQTTSKDTWNSEVEDVLVQSRNLMEKCIGKLDSVQEIRQLLIAIKMKHDYWAHTWTDSWVLANKDVDQILRPYVENLMKKDQLRKLLMIISETLLDTTEDLENTKFCAVCHREHGKLTWS